MATQLSKNFLLALPTHIVKILSEIIDSFASLSNHKSMTNQLSKTILLTILTTNTFLSEIRIIFCLFYLQFTLLSNQMETGKSIVKNFSFNTNSTFCEKFLGN